MPLNRFTIAFTLIVSFFGLILSISMAHGPMGEPGGSTLHKPLVGMPIMGICVMGIIAVLRPGPCSKVTGFSGVRQTKASKTDVRKDKMVMRIRGHHPDCHKFSSHVLKVLGRDYCVGCTGLLVGAILALLGAFAYFFAGLDVSGQGLVIIWMGTSGVILGFIHFSLDRIPGKTARLVVNAFFAIGAFLVLVAVDIRTQSILADLFVMVCIVFWILARIMLSRLNHTMICRVCAASWCDLYPTRDDF